MGEARAGASHASGTHPGLGAATSHPPPTTIRRRSCARPPPWVLPTISTGPLRTSTALRSCMRWMHSAATIRTKDMAKFRLRQGSAIAGRTAAYGRACFAWAMKRGTVPINPFAELPMSNSNHQARARAERRRSCRHLASGGRSPPPLWRHRPFTDAHGPTARGSGGDDVGRTFGRLGDLDDTSEANQERHSSSRAFKPASSRTSARPPVRQARGCSGRAQKRGAVKLVFPGERGTPFSGWSKAKSALDTASGVSGWWLHDLRRTLATGLQRLGVRLEVTEAVLNHLSGSRAGVVGIYQRHDWAEEKRAALDAWSAHLLAAVEGRLPQ